MFNFNSIDYNRLCEVTVNVHTSVCQRGQDENTRIVTK